MKKTIIQALLMLTTIAGFSKHDPFEKHMIKTVNLTGIDDGWYKATVKYTNYNTGTNSTYLLNVMVKYGTVSEIDFGNGGSVHSGYNNEGYFYSGGYLSYETDYSGAIIAATATVSISDTEGMRSFKIRIE